MAAHVIKISQNQFKSVGTKARRLACMRVCPTLSRGSLGDQAWPSALSLEIFAIAVRNYSQIALHSVS